MVTMYNLDTAMEVHVNGIHTSGNVATFCAGDKENHNKLWKMYFVCVQKQPQEIIEHTEKGSRLLTRQKASNSAGLFAGTAVLGLAVL